MDHPKWNRTACSTGKNPALLSTRYTENTIYNFLVPVNLLLSSKKKNYRVDCFPCCPGKGRPVKKLTLESEYNSSVAEGEGSNVMFPWWFLCLDQPPGFHGRFTENTNLEEWLSKICTLRNDPLVFLIMLVLQYFLGKHLIQHMFTVLCLGPIFSPEILPTSCRWIAGTHICHFM